MRFVPDLPKFNTGARPPPLFERPGHPFPEDAYAHIFSGLWLYRRVKFRYQAGRIRRHARAVFHTEGAGLQDDRSSLRWGAWR
jgi:hypothetical protein